MKTPKTVAIKIEMDAKEATRKLTKAADAAERLGKELGKLRGLEIDLVIKQDISRVPWWQFWK